MKYMIHNDIDICIFIESLEQGGAERVASILCNEWAKQGYKVALCTPQSDEIDSYPLATKVLRLSGQQPAIKGTAYQRIFARLSRVFYFNKILRNLKPKVSIAFMIESIIFQQIATTLCMTQPPLLIGSERSDPKVFSTSPVWSILRRWSYSNLHRMVAQTQSAAKDILKLSPKTKIEVIPNPIQYPIQSIEPYISIKNTIPSNKKFLLTVGRIIRTKQLDILIKIFSETLKNIQNKDEWILVIVGDGPERANLEKYTKSLCLEDKVYFLGKAGNVGDFLNSADIFAMTSREEGFPNALAEALAYGVPCIAFDCDYGPRDLIINGINGALIKLDDMIQYEKTLASMMRSPEIRIKFSKNSDEIKFKYSEKIIGEQWIKLLSTP